MYLSFLCLWQIYVCDLDLPVTEELKETESLHCECKLLDNFEFFQVESEDAEMIRESGEWDIMSS